MPERLSNRSAKELFEYFQRVDSEYKSFFTGKNLMSSNKFLSSVPLPPPPSPVSKISTMRCYLTAEVQGSNMAAMSQNIKKVVDEEQTKKIWLPVT